MLTLTCTRGLPGSGKSTWAKDQKAVRINRDDLRFSMFGKYWGLTYEQENLITSAERALATAALKAGENVVVDATHLRPKYLKDWNTFAVDHGAIFQTVEFPTDILECIKRDRFRDRTVGMAVIREQAEKYMPKGKFLPYHPFQAHDAPKNVAAAWVPYANPTTLPSCILVDIDGTMALMGDRKPYDWARVGEDTPNQPVVNLVVDLMRAGETIIFLSGRDGSCRAETQAWLIDLMPRKCGARLFMREAGDNRKDSIVKSEIFDREIRDKYHVKFVLDDRDQVVEMWRALGLPCFQVAPGEF